MTNDILFPDSLVGYWPCDNSTAEDISTNNNDGTFTNNYEVHTGQVGGGLLLGAGDYMNTSFPADFGTGAFTVSAWVKFKEIINDHLLGTFDGGGWVLQVFDGNLRFYDGSNGIDATTGPQQDTWFHVLWTRDDSGNSAIYINGNQDTTANNQGNNLDTAGTFRIGGSNDNAPDGYRAVYDEVRIWDRGFTQTDVDRLTAYYARGSTSELYKGLVGHWTLSDEKDNTPYDNHLTFYNDDGQAPEDDTEITNPTFTSEGKVGDAYDFAGDSYALIGDLGINNPATIMFWVDLNATADDHRPFGTFDGGDNASGSFGFNPTGSDEFKVWDGNQWRALWASNTSNTVDVWTHIAVTFNSNGDATAYVNGDEKLTANNVGWDYNGNTATIAGQYNGDSGQVLDGLMDDVRVYKGIVSQARIQQIIQQRVGLRVRQA